jgi:hypothetical protein
VGYISREDAYERLKAVSNQDFGYDGEAWAEWLDENIPDWRFATRPPSRLSRFLKRLRKKLR